MGLAASQGRFLLLTSRQSDVEMRMQSITNQKLALARESTALSSRHLKAMEAQNVMWCPSGSETATELTFGSMQGQDSPYFVTNAYGAVMLDGSSSFSNGILSALGMTTEQFLSKYPNGNMNGQDFEAAAGGKEKFLRNFVSGGFVNSTDSAQKGGIDSKISAVLADEERFAATNNKGTSVFETYYDSKAIKDMAFSGSAGVINPNQQISDLYTGSKTEHYATWGNGFANILNLSTGGFIGEIVDACNGVETKKTEYMDEGAAWNKLNSTSVVAKTAENAATNIKAITNNLSSALLITLCGGTDPNGTVHSGDLKDFKSEISSACAWAEQATLNKFLHDFNDQNSTDKTANSKNDPDSHGKVKDGYRGNNDASNDLDFRYTVTETSEHTWTGETTDTTTTFQSWVELNQDQVADTFLNYFDLYCEQHFSPNTNANGTATGNLVDTTQASLGSKGNVVTNDVSYRGYTYLNPNTNKAEAVGGTSGTNYCTINGIAVGQSADIDPTAAYWLRMYNQMCDNGIQLSSKLKDKDYVQQQMMYGNIVLNEFKGYSSKASVSLNDDESPMFLQDDEEAIEKENRRYEQEKNALDFKETLLDTMLTDLDAEREAIDTEKESVQKIIDNNIKKFKIFDA